MGIESFRIAFSRRHAALMVVAAIVVATIATIGVRTALGAGGGGGLCQPNGASPACTVKAHNAFAEFESVSPDGCVLSDTSVQAFEAMTKPGQGPALAVFVMTFAFNNCTGEFAGGGSNIDPSTGTPLFNGTAQYSTPLNTATVSGTAPMFDDFGNPAFTSTVNVSWQAFGPTTTYIDSTHFRIPGSYMTMSHDNSNTRNAVANGVVTDANGNNSTTTPSLQALVQDGVSGSVVIVKS